jgi:hypothetical protein
MRQTSRAPARLSTTPKVVEDKRYSLPPEASMGVPFNQMRLRL